jgi:O-antigen/teichoic acid export membrane protein
VKWTSAGTGIAALLGVVQGLVVARFLAPSEYGLMAAAAVVIGLGKAFADGGLSAAIIARRMSGATLSSLYWFNMATGLAIAAVVFASAPLVADFYREPGVAEVVRWSALIFVLAPSGAQFAQLLRRELDFRRLAIQQIVPAAIGTAVAVTAAASGAGAVSIVWGMLATTAANTVMTTSVGWRRWPPVQGFRWSLIRPHLAFGGYQMGERALNFLGANVDYILIGRFLGAGALGTYSLAYQVIVRPVLTFNPMIMQVAFPVFARRHDDDGALRRGYQQVVRMIAYVTMPLLAGLAVVAPDFVTVILGSKWEASVPILQILCLLGIIRCLANPVGSLLLAKDRADLGFRGNLWRFLLMAVSLAVAVQFGLLATAWTEVGVTAVAWLTWLLVLRRVVHLRLGEYAVQLAKPVGLTVAMALVVLALREALGGMDPAPRLVASIAAGAVVYLAGALAIDRDWLRGMWALFRRRDTVSVAAA